MFALYHGRKEATVSNWCVGHARLFQRMRAQKGCTVETLHNVLQWFSDNWPAELEWPTDIQRPKKSIPKNSQTPKTKGKAA